jgi:hypothetical protein
MHRVKQTLHESTALLTSSSPLTRLFPLALGPDHVMSHDARNSQLAGKKSEQNRVLLHCILLLLMGSNCAELCKPAGSVRRSLLTSCDDCLWADTGPSGSYKYSSIQYCVDRCCRYLLHCSFQLLKHKDPTLLKLRMI